MFFTLSKLFWTVAAPTNALLLIGLAGVVLQWTRWRPVGTIVTAVSLIIIAAAGISPMATILVRPLEDRFPAPPIDQVGPLNGIVVLGGAVGLVRGQVSLSSEAARMTEAVALARRYPEARLVFAGGSGELLPDDALTEADGARAFFRSLGLADDRTIYEGQSRNTRENAIFAKTLVQPKPGERWLLVTSAFHMPRAVGVFRATGWTVIPYPVDFISEGDRRDYFRLNRSVAIGLATLDLVVKEWIGLVAYRLAGYSSELLPGPVDSAARSR